MTGAHPHAVPWYWKSLDFERLTRDFPPPPDYFDTVYRLSRDELRARQEKRFLVTIARGWEIPFFQRHWRQAGMEPGDIRGLDDLPKIPPYTVHHIRDSIERNPPFGDFMGISPADGGTTPLVLQTSGGTTGLPRPMLYAPQRPRDDGHPRRAPSVHAGRAARRHDPGHVFAGAVERRLRRARGDLEILGRGAGDDRQRRVDADAAADRDHQAWGITVILGFPSYLRHMALVARDEMNIDPRSLGVRLLGSHLGQEDRRQIEELWGAPCFDAYGTNESGMMAAECQHKSGMHIQEDAVHLEIADPETGRILPDGEKGTVYITTFYRHGAPQIRFNVNDISAMVPGTCACGSTLRRMDRIFGRNDNMIKLRGVNVFPEAIGETIGAGPAHERRVLLHRRTRGRSGPRRDDRDGRDSRPGGGPRGRSRRSGTKAERGAGRKGRDQAGRSRRPASLYGRGRDVEDQAAARQAKVTPRTEPSPAAGTGRPGNTRRGR